MTVTANTQRDTATTIALFNAAFQAGDVEALNALVHDQCVMVSAQPAPDGETYAGREACVAFWAELMTDPSTTFEVRQVFTSDEWAAVSWRYCFGPTSQESVLGVNITRVSDGQVIEQLGYTKAPGAALPLPADDVPVVHA